MEFDAFSNNIEPGGLRNITEIKVLLCYLLTSVDVPLSRLNINEIIAKHGIANYFEVNNALDSLAALGVICEKNGEFSATDKARTIASDLDVLLPYTVRSQAVEAAAELLTKARRESENIVNITKTDRGYNVECKTVDGELCLLSMSIYVADILQAEKIRRNFVDNAATVYGKVISAVFGEE